MVEPAPATADGPVDEAVLARLQTLAYVLDDAFRIPGTNVRFGLDPVVGVLPVGGDAVTTLLSLYVVLEGVRAGAPPGLVARMVAILVVDAVVGSIPLVGPLFDARWKANARNVELLVEHLETRAEGDGPVR